MTLDQFLSPTLAITMPTWAVALLVVGFLFVSVVMILIVLIQRPQGGGLSGAFGAGGGSAGQTAFGARTGDALTIATITIFILYLLVAVFLNYAIVPPSVENPSITTAAETIPEGEADDTTVFTQPTPVILGDSENVVISIDPDAPVGPVSPLPEEQSEEQSEETSTEDNPSDG